jgi:Fur family transcriptional regulator, ferric uptake regulator
VADDRAEEILDRLRAGGGRVTRSRRLVVGALLDGPGHHVTAPEVVEAVRRVDPAFHESSVYRTLDRLTELGLVTRIEVAGGPAVFHLPRRAHHHLVCERCGRIAGASTDLLADVAERLASEHGFALRAEAVTLPGRCAACEAGDDTDAAAPVVPGPAHDHDPA